MEIVLILLGFVCGLVTAAIYPHIPAWINQKLRDAMK